MTSSKRSEHCKGILAVSYTAIWNVPIYVKRLVENKHMTSKGQLPPSSHRHLRSESNARHIRERVVIHRKRHQQGRGHVLLLHITPHTRKYDVRLQVTLRGQ